ncbi:hypothetical protein [Arcobacter sp.]|uniref:hypothetical protein n=1 Tax=Arcobacter sp. TaxID=1872629 RepID=UPI003C790FD6
MRNLVLSLAIVITANAMSNEELGKQLVCIENINTGVSVSRVVPTVERLDDYLFKVYKGKHHKFELNDRGSFNHFFIQYGKEEIKAFYKKTKSYDGRDCHIIYKLRVDGTEYTDKANIMFKAIDWGIPINQ